LPDARSDAIVSVFASGVEFPFGSCFVLPTERRFNLAGDLINPTEGGAKLPVECAVDIIW
jgi:hypothetical protein